MLPPSPTVRRAFDLFYAKKLDQAEQVLRRHLTKEPRDATGNHAMAAVLLSLGRFDQASFFSKRANELFPHDFSILSVLGTALAASGDARGAVEAYREATHLAPDKPTLWSGLGVAYMATDQLDEAAPALERAIAMDPKELSGPMNLAVCHTRLGDANASLRVMIEALKHFPSEYGLLLHSAAMSNYADFVSAAEVRRMHDSLARAIEQRVKGRREPLTEPLKGRPLRVGLLSGDFYNHSCSFFLEPLLAHFAEEGRRRESGIELVCFSSTHSPDAVTARLKGYGHPWRDVVKMSDEACADCVRGERIDVLIDCAGYTHDTRVQVLAQGAAPVQMTYLGYPNTTALKDCHFRIVDSVTDPIGSEGQSGEELIRLDPHFLCYTPTREDRVAAIEERPPRERTGRVTFGSFNALMKVVDMTIEAWARVLRETPGSRLLLKSKHQRAKGRLAAGFEKHGIDPTRVEVLAPVGSSNDHMALYNEVDVALDPFPYNGTTTTYEALSMGVPVVALRGDRHASRVSASILTVVGAGELISEDVAGYVRLATELAADPERLARYRGELRPKLLASAACDRADFAGRFAAALHKAWEAKAGGS